MKKLRFSRIADDFFISALVNGFETSLEIAPTERRILVQLPLTPNYPPPKLDLTIWIFGQSGREWILGQSGRE